MDRKILVYGNSDKSEDGGFPTAERFDHYIREGVYLNEDGRYRYTQTKEAEVIVLSRDGVLHGHFEIDDKEPPNERDRTEYPTVKAAYLVRASFLYGNQISLSNFGITGIQFGKYISEETFREITAAVGEVQRFAPPSVAST